MSQTQVAAGSALARKVFGAALFAQTVRAPGFSNKITGAAPKQSDAEAKMKGQTSPDMPIVRVTDLSKSAGETISVDMFNTIGGAPLVGDVNAEGRGSSLTSSSMDISINLLTKVVDAGGRMAQQRTVHQLRGLAMAQLASYFPRLDDQLSLVHLAGARGSQTGVDWVVPLQYAATTATTANADFAPIAINTVKAPTYNRHFVTDGTSLVQGGAQLASVATDDSFKLEHLDELRNRLDSMEFPLQPVKIADDPAASDEPLWVMYVTSAMWNSILTGGTAGNTWRTFLQNAWNRKSYGSKHPLFSGEAGIWNGILVRKMDRMAIQFGASEVLKHVTSANAATATETDVTVAAGLSTTHVVHRGLLLGAQALATVYGRNQSGDYHMSWMERPYNFERNLEVAADVMGGKAKLRFSYPNSDGSTTPTDHGVIVVDTVVAKPNA
jgi:N4-gp56 family major capsid protein